MNRKTAWSTVLGLVAAIAILSTGCGGGGGSSATTGPASSGSTVTTPVSDAATPPGPPDTRLVPPEPPGAKATSSRELTSRGIASFHLVKGWNLISFPVLQLSELTWSSSVYARLWAWDGAVQNWSTISNTVAAINSGAGTRRAFWVYAYQASDIGFTGAPDDGSAASLGLSRGWNLVGVPCTSSLAIRDLTVTDPATGTPVALSQVAGASPSVGKSVYRKAWEWVDGQWSLVDLTTDTSTLATNKGFWFYVWGAGKLDYPPGGVSVAGKSLVQTEMPNVQLYFNPDTEQTTARSARGVGAGAKAVSGVTWLCQRPAPYTATSWKQTVNCGQTCMVMAANHLKSSIPATWDEIKLVDDWITANGLGNKNRFGPYSGDYTNVAILERVGNEFFGLKAEAVTSASVAQLKDEINHGCPVIVGVLTEMVWQGDNYHFMLLTDINDTTVTVYDPGRSPGRVDQPRVFSRALFDAAWQRNGYGMVTVHLKGDAPSNTTPQYSVGQGAPNKAVFEAAYSRTLNWGNTASVYLGRATGSAYRWGNGWVQTFEGGRYGAGAIMLADGADYAYSVWGTFWPILTRDPLPGYNQSSRDLFGYPISDTRIPSANERDSCRWYGGTPAANEGSIQCFQKGYMTWTSRGSEWLVFPNYSTDTPPCGIVGIKTSGGYYLTAEGGGGVEGPGAVSTNRTSFGDNERFTMIPVGQSTYGIRTNNGRFLTAMYGGGVGGGDTIHTNATRIQSWEQFTFVARGAGKYALRTYNGHFLSAPNGGNIAGAGSVITTASTIGTNEEFTLSNLPPAISDIPIVQEGTYSSPLGRFHLYFQSDGNLVLYDSTPLYHYIWTSWTVGKGGVRCVMQWDGNLVIYDANNNPVWATNTSGNPGSKLVLQEDGNMVIYRSNGTPSWCSQTCLVELGPSVVIYDSAELKGESFCTDEDQPNLVSRGWNDRTVSIRIRHGTWRFHQDINNWGSYVELPPGVYPSLDRVNLPPNWVSSFYRVN